LAVGRLSREKGHADLIRALAYLRPLEPSLKVRLVIAGDGPERSRIARLASALRLSEQVTLVGQVSRIQPYYAAADLLVLPSHSEGSPNVLLEAMAASLPIVATTVGGIPEIVTHQESALLVEPRAVPTLAAAIGCLLRDEPQARRLAAQARLAVRRHAPEARRRALMEIYRELVCDTLDERLPISAPAREWA
jgi:glycosyltransferase involved in cell wall biosynthesis